MLAFFCLLTAIVFSVLPLSAQAPAGRRSIDGSVLDPDGAAVPAVSVELRSPKFRQPRVVSTDVNGNFRFTGLERGTYELYVQLAGFKPSTHTVNLTAQGAKVRIPLELAGVSQEVVVTAESQGVAVDPAANAEAIELDRETIADLPVLGNDPIAAAMDFLDPSAMEEGGGSLVVDGLETTEVGVSASAIQEIRINRNPYSAEFFRPGRGRIEVITRRGDPQYNGDFRFLFRDFRLDARNAFAVERAPEQRRIFEGSLTGPILNSKEYFFVISAESQQEDLWSPVYALTPSGLLQEQAFQPQRENEFSIRVERRPDSGSSMSLRYEREYERQNGLGIGGFRLPETGSDSREVSDRLQFSHQSFWTPTMGNNLIMRVRNSREEQVSRVRGTPRIVVVDAFTSGGAQADQLRNQQRLELSDVVSWSSNKHYIRAGVNVHEIGRARFNDLTNRDGTFYFSSLDEYLMGRPFSYIRQTGSGRATFWRASGGAFIQDDIRLRPDLTLAAGVRYDTQNWLGDRNNFSPRVSVAYSPGKENKTVIRAGAGLFYDRLGGNAPLDLLLYGGGRLLENIVPFPSYPDPFANGSGELLPASIVRFADDLRAPYMLHYMTTVERQILPRMTLSVGYSGIRGAKQFRSRDLNAPLGPDFVRPDPAVATLRQLESSGRLVRHSMNIALRGRITQYFNGAVMYNLGRTWNHANGSGALPANSYDLSGEWARASYDRLHRFRALGSFKVADLFTLGTVVRLESGAPYSLTTGRDLNQDGSAIDRPAGVGRNTLQGPGAATVDLRLSKQFAFRSQTREQPPRITVSADAFNVFNTVNYTGFVGNMSSPFFGLPVSSRPARRVQLMLRFSF